jgi:bacteriocin-like protein
MSDQEKKQQSTNISPQPDTENKKKSTELSEEELKKVSGGRKAGGDPL